MCKGGKEQEVEGPGSAKPDVVRQERLSSIIHNFLVVFGFILVLYACIMYMSILYTHIYNTSTYLNPKYSFISFVFYFFLVNVVPFLYLFVLVTFGIYSHTRACEVLQCGSNLRAVVRAGPHHASPQEDRS